MSNFTRRGFLCASAVGAAASCGDLSFLGQLTPVAAAEAALDSKSVLFRPEIEPLVKLLEDTERGRVLEEVAAKIRAGHKLPRSPGGSAVGRRSQCATSTFGGVQIPCGAGGQLRTLGQPFVARFRSLAADLLGD